MRLVSVPPTFRHLAALLIIVLVVAGGVAAGAPERALAWDNGTASTPPMGWNS